MPESGKVPDLRCTAKARLRASSDALCALHRVRDKRVSMKHVAVLMGGWSSERQVSLWSGTACADALDRTGRYKVSRVDVDRDIAIDAARAQARLRAQRPARPARRGRHDSGHARDPRHSVQPFRRHGFGGGEPEGHRQDGAEGGRHPRARRPAGVARTRRRRRTRCRRLMSSSRWRKARASASSSCARITRIRRRN